MSYASDLSQEQWSLIEPFFERPDPRGAKPERERERVVEAILYRLREGCRWRSPPHGFPGWSTVASHFRPWRRRGVWQEAVLALNTFYRQEEPGRSRRAPRHAILDSQSVQTAAEAEARGFQGGKKVKGRSRHVAVDSRGTLLAVSVTAAKVSARPRRARSWLGPRKLAPAWRASRPTKAFAAGPSGPPTRWTAHRASRPRTRKKRLCADCLPLAGGAHLRLAGPMPPARQRLRENRGECRSLDLDSHVALARATVSLITTQVLTRVCRRAR